MNNKNGIQSVQVLKRRELWPVTDMTKHFTTWMQEAKAMYIYVNALTPEMVKYANCYRIQFASGLSVSIQASENHYCHPRIDVPCSQYTEFELGFPSMPVKEILDWVEYQRDGTDPCDAIYPYTPRHAIEAMFIAHGGITGFYLPEGK